MPSTPPHAEGRKGFRVHRIRGAILMRALIFVIISFAGMLFSVGVLIWQWRNAMLNFGPAALWHWITLPLSATLIFALLALISFTLYRHVRQLEIQVSKLGMTFQRGKRLDSINWQDVKQIWTSFERYGVFTFSWANKTEIQVMTEAGKNYKFNQSYEGIDELIEEIKHFVYPNLLENYRLAFNRGEPLTFGPLVLTSDGILKGRKALRWKDLGEIDLDRGSLNLQPFESSKASRLSIQAHKVPNIDLCVQLINHLSPQT